MAVKIPCVLASPSLIVGITIIILVAGAVNGVAGFGFALVGTMALATVIDPATAVVFMIAPILAVNLSLIRELSIEELRTCGRRFGPLVFGALVGTVVGLVVLDRIPQAPLKIGLGVVTLAFVASAQQTVPIPGQSGLFRRIHAGDARSRSRFGRALWRHERRCATDRVSPEL